MKNKFFYLAIAGFFASSGLWFWLAYPDNFYPLMFFVGLAGLVAMLIGGYGFFFKKELSSKKTTWKQYVMGFFIITTIVLVLYFLVKTNWVVTYKGNAYTF